MKNCINITKFEALNNSELQKTSGGCLFMLAMCITADALVGLAIYGAFMEGYNDGKKAAQN